MLHNHLFVSHFLFKASSPDYFHAIFVQESAFLVLVVLWQFCRVLFDKLRDGT